MLAPKILFIHRISHTHCVCALHMHDVWEGKKATLEEDEEEEGEDVKKMCFVPRIRDFIPPIFLESYCTTVECEMHSRGL